MQKQQNPETGQIYLPLRLKGRDLEHRRLYSRSRYKSSPYSRLHRYGMTRRQYDDMVRAQEGKCAICLVTPKKIGRRDPLEIDHDHRTNKVRGLLCPRCNRWLAALDEPGWLANAQFYLLKESDE